MGKIEDLEWAIKNEQQIKKDAKTKLTYQQEDYKANIKRMNRRIAKARRQIKKLK